MPKLWGIFNRRFGGVNQFEGLSFFGSERQDEVIGLLRNGSLDGRLRQRQPAVTERQFYNEMLSIFCQLRDLHTSFVLPEPFRSGLIDRLVGQRSRAGDDSDAALLEDVTGHDSDLALSGRHHPRAIWTDQP